MVTDRGLPFWQALSLGVFTSTSSYTHLGDGYKMKLGEVEGLAQGNRTRKRKSQKLNPGSWTREAGI